MANAFHKSRRQFVGAAFASFGVAAMAPRSAGAAAPNIVATAKAALARKGALIAHHDVVGVADFGQPSKAPRLHLVDMASGKVESLLVSHGRGSDPSHTGWLVDFSNTVGSDATSAGAYVTGDYYMGEHGRSMRLVGLDPSNSNARARDIVVHSAWYVGPNIVQAHGMVGCSEGCFAVSPSDLPHMLQRLGPGRLLVATKL